MIRIAPLLLLLLGGCSYTQATATVTPENHIASMTLTSWNFGTDREAHLTRDVKNLLTIDYGTKANEAVAGQAFDTINNAIDKIPVPGVLPAPAPAVRRSALEPAWRAVRTPQGTMMEWVAGEP